MKNKLIISASGPDRQGIVSQISSIISENSGNIETSRMIRLEEFFSILILIEIEDKRINNLKNELKLIKDLKIDTNSTINIETNYKNKFHLYINGADNEGIVYSFSNYLSKLNINIEEVNTRIENASMSATPLFMMDIIVTTKEEINKDKINTELNKMADSLGVEVIFKKN